MARLVIWTLQGIQPAKPNEPVVIDLDSHPAIAQAIGGGRITSHNVVAWGQNSPTVTFIVED